MRLKITGMALATVCAALVVPVLAAPAQAAPAGAAKTAAVNDAAERRVPAATAVSVAAAATPTAVKGRAEQVSGPSTSHLDGVCNRYSDNTGDLCLWYFQNYSGSRIDFYAADSSLYDNVFISPGSGQGAVVANNSESDFNYDGIYTAWVCTGTSYTGTCGFISPLTGGNFSLTYKNQVESLYWA